MHCVHCGSEVLFETCVAMKFVDDDDDDDDDDVLFNDALTLLDVTLDVSLSFDKYVSNVVRACTFHPRASAAYLGDG